MINISPKCFRFSPHPPQVNVSNGTHNSWLRNTVLTRVDNTVVAIIHLPALSLSLTFIEGVQKFQCVAVQIQCRLIFFTSVFAPRLPHSVILSLVSLLFCILFFTSWWRVQGPGDSEVPVSVGQLPCWARRGGAGQRLAVVREVQILRVCIKSMSSGDSSIIQGLTSLR